MTPLSPLDRDILSKMSSGHRPLVGNRCGSLRRLEASGLVRTQWSAAGIMVYVITSEGKRVLEEMIR